MNKVQFKVRSDQSGCTVRRNILLVGPVESQLKIAGSGGEEVGAYPRFLMLLLVLRADIAVFLTAAQY
ncbi:hypothetical protein T02_15693 [Trichinella nativa]|uniref:Uncharacterized protein n=1 Tax=Trichinella nativa TaxID=6335 RepID=A0A0V1KTC9_9BILA|nr:hypothetical protein T02_15693 [Trichinella nativa]